MTPNQSDSSALALPDHILFSVIENFVDENLSSIGTVAQVCRDYHNALSNPSFWSLKLYGRFDAEFFHPCYTSTSHIDPRSVYQATHVLEKCFTRGLFSAKSNFRTPNSIITAIRIHDGNLVVGASDGSVKYVGLPNDSAAQAADLTGTINSHPDMSGVTCLAPLGCDIVSGHTDGSLFVHKPTSPERLPTQLPLTSPITSIAGIGDTKVFFSTHGCIQMYDLETQTRVLTKRTSPDALPNSVSVRGSVAVIGFRDKKARIIDLRSGEYVTSIAMSNWCLCVETDSSDYILRASDRAVKTFDLRSPSAPLDIRHGTNRLISQFKSDSKLRLVSCGLDGQVLVSSLEPSKCFETPQSVHACEDYILTLDFDRTRLACGGINGKYNLFTF